MVEQPRRYDFQLVDYLEEKALPSGEPFTIDAPGSIVRKNRSAMRARAETVASRPLRLGHITVFMPDVLRSINFFELALGMALADRATDVIAFMRCRKDNEHHVVASAKSPGVGFHYARFHIEGSDDVGHNGAALALMLSDNLGEVLMFDLQKRLIGGWRMVDWALTDDENVDHFLPPFGLPQDCGGMLIYSESGVMSAMLSRRTRLAFKDRSLDGGTIEERAEAFSSITSYSGTFETDDSTSQVTHVVEFATMPHLVGDRMIRICMFDGDRLKLDTPSMTFGGKSRRSYIEWERIG